MPVRDGDHVSEAAGKPAGPGDAAAARREHGGARRGGEVEARMEVVATRAEAVADAGGERPGESNRRAPRLGEQSPNRSGPRDPVASKAGPALEANDRRSDMRAKAAIDRRIREPVPSKKELKLRNVEPARARSQRASAKTRPSTPSEGRQSLRPRDAINSNPSAPLKRPQPSPRAG